MRLAMFSVLAFAVAVSGAPSRPGKQAKVAVDPAQELRAQLLAFDSEVGPGDFEKAMRLYYAPSTREKRVVQSLVRVDCALSDLQQQTHKRFGKEVADALIHAAGAKTAVDVLAAKITVTGETATVLFPGDAEPVDMVLKQGRWQIPGKSMFRGVPSTLARFRKGLDGLAEGFSKLAAEIKIGGCTQAEDASAQVLKLRQAFLAQLQ